MQKIRGTYKKYQLQVFGQNPRKVASQKAKQYAQSCNNQMIRMQDENNFSNLDQVAFYKQKFQSLAKVAQNYEKKKINQDKYHDQVKKILKDDPPVSKQIERRISGGEREEIKPFQSSKSKSPLKDFFDDQDVKMSKKKVTFGSVMNDNQVPLNYGLRSVVKSKHNHLSTSQLKRLEQQNRQLRQKNNKRDMNPVDVNEYKLNQLKQRVRELDQQNRKLRQLSSKQSSTYQVQQEPYDPYSLKCRQNNIYKINNRNVQFSQRNSKYAYDKSNQSQYSLRNSRKGEDMYQIDRYPRSQFGDDFRQPKSQFGKTKSIYNNNILDSQILNSSQQTIQTQFLNLQNSQLYDPAKNQICRQKIAFFKKSMILVKDKEFQIAFKRSDFNKNMDTLRLILYVNNKTNYSKNCQIVYDYQRSDYDIKVKKQLRSVDPRSQGREEIQIYLNSINDYGSLINAEVNVGGTIKKIVVPALFIDFNPEYKYNLSNPQSLQRKLSSPIVIRPMTQYSSVDKAGNIIDLARQYDQKYETAKLYGRSKACDGIVKLSWKSKTRLQIQTCETWKFLIGYLFLNADEAVQY